MDRHYGYSALKTGHWLATSVFLSFCVPRIFDTAARRSFFFEPVDVVLAVAAQAAERSNIACPLQQALTNSNTTKDVADHETKEKGRTPTQDQMEDTKELKV